MRKSFLFGLLMILFLISSNVQAQDFAELSLEDLLNVTVTSAGGREQKKNEISQAMTVITKEDIERSGAKMLSDLFWRVPGIQTTASFGWENTVGIRGESQSLTNNILVLLDGVVVFNPGFNGTYWTHIPVTLDEIERIEIIRGSAGVLYSSNAVNGVINIITKGKTDEKYVKYQSGTQQFQRGTFGLGTKSSDEKLYIRGAFQYDDQDGYDKKYATGNYHSYLTRRIGLLRADYDFSDDMKLSVYGKVSDDVEHDQDILMYNIKKPIGIGTISANFSNKVNDFYDFSVHTDAVEHRSTIITSNDVDVHTSSLSTQHNLTYSLFGDHVTSFGGEYRRNKTDVSEDILTNCEDEQTILSFFFQDEYRPWEKWIFSAGTRADKNSNTQTNTNNDIWYLSPRFSAIYLANDNHTFRTSASRSYRMPSILEKQANILYVPAPVIYVKGETNLQPEKIWSYDIGHSALYFDKKMAVNSTLFFARKEDHIGLSSLIIGAPLSLKYENNGDMNWYGFEIDGNYKISDEVTVYADYSLLQIFYENDHSSADLQGSAYPPIQHQPGVGLKYTKNQWKVDFYVKWFSSTLMGANAVTGASGEKLRSYFKPTLRIAKDFKLRNYDAEFELVANDWIGARVYESNVKYERETEIFAGLKVNF